MHTRDTKLPTVPDQRLCPNIMPKPRRSQKRKAPPEGTPSSAAEVATATGEGRRLKGKQVAEKVGFDSRSSVPQDHILPAPGPQAGPSQPSGGHDEVEDPDLGPLSEAELVSAIRVFRVIIDLPPSKAEFFPDVGDILLELHRLEAHPTVDPSCSACDPPAEYRCSTCTFGELECKQCILSRHANNPLHDIEVWFYHSLQEQTLRYCSNGMATPSRTPPSLPSALPFRLDTTLAAAHAPGLAPESSQCSP
jgi:hypothetical protein